MWRVEEEKSGSRRSGRGDDVLRLRRLGQRGRSGEVLPALAEDRVSHGRARQFGDIGFDQLIDELSRSVPQPVDRLRLEGDEELCEQLHASLAHGEIDIVFALQLFPDGEHEREDDLLDVRGVTVLKDWPAVGLKQTPELLAPAALLEQLTGVDLREHDEARSQIRRPHQSLEASLVLDREVIPIKHDRRIGLGIGEHAIDLASIFSESDLTEPSLFGHAREAIPQLVAVTPSHLKDGRPVHLSRERPLDLFERRSGVSRGDPDRWRGEIVWKVCLFDRTEKFHLNGLLWLYGNERRLFRATTQSNGFCWYCQY